MLIDVLDVATIRNNTSSSTSLLIISTVELGEAPLARDDNLLLSGELELAATQSLNDNGLVGVLGADAHQDLANVHTGNGTSGLTKGTTHTSLQTIGTSTRKHFVDADDVEGMDTHAHVEAVLSTELADVLVGADTGSLQGLAAQLLTLIGDEVDAEREFVDGGLLATQVVDTDLGIGDTATEATLGVGLVAAVAVAASRTTTHLHAK